MSRPSFSTLVAATPALLMLGCSSYSSPFVHKTEDELNAMEQQASFASTYFHSSDYDVAHRKAEELTLEQTVNRPLYQLELLSILLMEGKREQAHQLMLNIQNDIERLFNPAIAQSTDDYWHGESEEVFTGDSHERTIFYTFLAMSHMERKEYKKALQSIQKGLHADTSKEAMETTSDFALLHYLGYVASRYANDYGKAAAFKRQFVATLRAQGKDAIEADNAWANLTEAKTLPNAFLILWSGTPPTFVRGGTHDDVRHVIPGHDNLTMVTVEDATGHKLTVATGLGDVNFQATTRAGQVIDEVRQDKKAVKRGLAASDNVFAVAGASCFEATAQTSNPLGMIAYSGAGLGCFVIGGPIYGITALSSSEADIRHWRNLPGNLSIVPLHLPENNQTLTIRGYYGWDNIIRESCTIPVAPEQISICHFSLMPFAGNVRKPWEKYIEECKKSSLRQSTPLNWMKHEITE